MKIPTTASAPLRQNPALMVLCDLLTSTFLPRNVVIARYMLSSVVSPSVCHKSEFTSAWCKTDQEMVSFDLKSDKGMVSFELKTDQAGNGQF